MNKLWLILPLALLPLGSVSADVVHCKDGRTLEGEVLEQTDESVLVDTQVGSIRAAVRVPMAEVTEVERGPVSPGFFSTDPEGDARADGAVPYAPGTERYLVVPVEGAFGQDVYVKGLQRALSYALRNRVEHVVFEISSEGTHDMDEARAAFRLLGKYADRLQFHAWVKKATGDSLAILLQAHTIHVAPGARIGGALGAEDTDEETAEELAALREVLASGAETASQARGRPGVLARAMLDPAVALVCYLDAEGRPVNATAAPEGVAADELVIDCPAGELLVVTSEQLAKLGVPAYEGDASGLGETLGLSSWVEESQYGASAMRRAVTQAQAAETKEQKAAAAYAVKVEKLVRRRDGLVEALEHALAKAQEWDPTQGEYATYKRASTWAWGGGYGGVVPGVPSHPIYRPPVATPYGGNQTDNGGGGGGEDTNVLTKDSRKHWQIRTDYTVGYLNQALRAVRSLKTVEKRAAKLGIEPAYSLDELARMQTDFKARVKQLRAERNRKER